METMSNIPSKGTKKRVVIVGGGFGGLKLARQLNDRDFQVILLDRNNYHLFQPLLYQAAFRVLAEKILLAASSLQLETFQVVILLVGIVKGSRPNLIRIILLNIQYIRFVMIAQIEIGRIEIAILKDHQDQIVTLELAQLFSTPVIIQA